MDALSRMTLILAIATFLLAIAAFWSIWENRRMREEERERESRRRALDDVQNWIAEVLSFRSDYTRPDLSDWQKKELLREGRTLTSKEEYIKMQATRFDYESTNLPKLADQIARISFIIEHPAAGYPAEALQRELEQKCVDVLKALCDLRAKEKL